MAHLTRAELGGQRPLPSDTDVLVVGAGMAGLYVAWRLLRQDPDRRVCVVDLLDRTGGRLVTDVVRLEGADVKEEEGGMRFTFETMDDLVSLLLLLGLDDQVVPFPMSSGGSNRLCFRGRSFTAAEAAADGHALWGELYDLGPDERGIDPRAIIRTALDRIIAENPQLPDPVRPRPPEFWQALRLDCSWAGIRLNEWTLWGLLDAMGHSHECLSLLSRLLGFNGTLLSEMNAGEAFQLLGTFGAEPRFLTLRKGFSSLPNRLACEVGPEHLYLGTTVDRIAAAGGGHRVAYTTQLDGGAVSGEITARTVVLAMPRLALERLYSASDLVRRVDARRDHQLWNALQTTTNQALIKINLYYPTAWWGARADRATPLVFGPNVSDLPLGTVYPFYALDPAVVAAAEYERHRRRSGRPPAPGTLARLEAIAADTYNRPAALTVYCDHVNAGFWRALQHGGGPLFDSPGQRQVSAAGPQTIHPATEAVVEAATRMLAQLFDVPDVPRPVLTSARIWSGATTVGAGAAEHACFGVHQWRVHADDRAVIDHLVEPLPGLFTCGEAYSDYQGWVEGALRSADLVLARAFDLEPISEVVRRGGRGGPAELITAGYARRAGELVRRHVDPAFEDAWLGLT